jgi:hypothetical protein
MLQQFDKVPNAEVRTLEVQFLYAIENRTLPKLIDQYLAAQIPEPAETTTGYG